MIDIIDNESFDRNIKHLKRAIDLPLDMQEQWCLKNLEQFHDLSHGPDWNDLEFNYDEITIDEWHKSYSEKSHEKWLKMKSYKPIEKFDKLPLPIKYCFSLWFELIPEQYKDLALIIIDKIGLMKPILPKTLVGNIDVITIFAKKRQSRWSNGWFYFVDMTSLTGFNNKTTLKQVEPKLFEWLEEKPLKGEKFMNDYLTKFEDNLYSEMSNHIKTKRPYILQRFKDWVADENNWATKGSSSGIKAKYEDGGVSPPLKAAIATNFSVEQMEKLFMSTESEIFQPNVKIEAGQKDRVIISAGNSLYIKMSYVSAWLEKILNGWSKSTLFMNNEDKITKVYFNKIKMIKQSNVVFLPLDAKGFDQNVSQTEIDSVFNVITRLLLKFNPTHDLLSSMSRIKRQWKSMFIKINNKLYPWKDGLPSGVRWTALLGTLVNIGRFLTISKFIESKIGKSYYIDEFFAQGDDDDIACTNYISAYLTFKLYSEFEIPVNIKKNFISRDSTEFLRKITLIKPMNCTIGYLSRAILKTMFIDPLNRPRDENDHRLDEWLNIWNILYSRLADVEKLRYFMLNEMKRVATSIGVNHLMWLNTPRTLHGGGFLTSGNTGFAYTVKFENLKHKIIIDKNSIVQKRILKTNEFFKTNVTDTITESKSVSLSPNTGNPFKNIYHIKAIVNWNLVNDEYPNVRYVSYDVKAEFKNMYVTEGIDSLIERKEWDKLKEICNIESEQKFDLYLNKITRKQFIAWIKNDLPGSQPIDLRFSPEFVSLSYKRISDGAKSYVLSKDMSWERIQNIMVTAEYKCKEELNISAGTYIYGS